MYADFISNYTYQTLKYVIVQKSKYCYRNKPNLKANNITCAQVKYCSFYIECHQLSSTLAYSLVTYIKSRLLLESKDFTRKLDFSSILLCI